MQHQLHQHSDVVDDDEHTSSLSPPVDLRHHNKVQHADSASEASSSSEPDPDKVNHISQEHQPLLTDFPSFDGHVTSGPLAGTRVRVVGKRGPQWRVAILDTFGVGLTPDLVGQTRFLHARLVAKGDPPAELKERYAFSEESARRRKANKAQDEAARDAINREKDRAKNAESERIVQAEKEARRARAAQEAAAAVRDGRNFRIVADAAPVFNMPSIHATQLGIKKKLTSVRCSDEEVRDEDGNLQWIKLASWTYDTDAWMLVDGSCFGKGVLAQAHRPLGLVVDGASGVSAAEKTLAANHYSTGTARERLERLVAFQEKLQEEDRLRELEDEKKLKEVEERTQQQETTATTKSPTMPPPPPPPAVAQPLEDLLYQNEQQQQQLIAAQSKMMQSSDERLAAARARLATAEVVLADREDELDNRLSRLNFKRSLHEEIIEVQGEGQDHHIRKEIDGHEEPLDAARERLVQARDELKFARDDIRDLEQVAKKEALRAAFRLEPAGADEDSECNADDDCSSEHPMHPQAVERLRELVRLRKLLIEAKKSSSKESSIAEVTKPSSARRLSARERLELHRQRITKAGNECQAAAQRAAFSESHAASLPAEAASVRTQNTLASRVRSLEEEIRCEWIGAGRPLPTNVLDGGDEGSNAVTYLRKCDARKAALKKSQPEVSPGTATTTSSERRLLCHPHWLYRFSQSDDNGAYHGSDDFVNVYNAPTSVAPGMAYTYQGEPVESGVTQGEGAPPASFACCARTNRVFVGFDKTMERDRSRAPVLVYDVESGKMIGRCRGGRGGEEMPELQHVKALALHRLTGDEKDRELLLALGADRTVLVWDASTLQFLSFISAGAEGFARVSGVFDAETHSYKSPVTCQSLHLDVLPASFNGAESERLVVFASSLGKQRTDATSWDITQAVADAGSHVDFASGMLTGEARYVQSFVGQHAKHVTCVATIVLAAEDEHLLFTGGMDALIIQWNARTGVAERRFAQDHAGSIRFLATDGAFARGDGIRTAASRADAAIYSCGADNTIRRWSVFDGRCTRVFEGGHDSPCTSFHVSDDGRTLVTSWSGYFGFATVKVWHLRSPGVRDAPARRSEGTVLHVLSHIPYIEQRGYAACGCDASAQYIYVGAADGTLSCWRVDETQVATRGGRSKLF